MNDFPTTNAAGGPTADASGGPTTDAAGGFPLALSEAAELPVDKIGVVIVDHGSRRRESNALLDEVVSLFRSVTGLANVQVAHMELASPSIADAFDAAVSRGAELVVVFPYFLSPGRHWSQDIPALAGEAAANHPGVRHLVTAPLGLHAAIMGVIQDRITQCLDHARGGDDCSLCSDGGACQMNGAC
ncbi:MAG: CbiX/SirB N-terminal domain-containing protein [Planctomycetota bacterium]